MGSVTNIRYAVERVRLSIPRRGSLVEVEEGGGQGRQRADFEVLVGEDGDRQREQRVRVYKQWRRKCFFVLFFLL